MARSAPLDRQRGAAAIDPLVEYLQIFAHGRKRFVAQHELLDVAAKGFGLSLANDSALIQNGDFIGHRLDFVKQVRAVEYGASLPLQMGNKITVELLAHDRIQP